MAEIDFKCVILGVLEGPYKILTLAVTLILIVPCADDNSNKNVKDVTSSGPTLTRKIETSLAS